MHSRFKRIAEKLRSMPSLTRIVIGVLLLLGGLLWFLPVLGLWMIPLGLLILSADFPWARRGYLSIIVRWRRMRAQRREKKAQRKLEKARKDNPDQSGDDG